MGCDIHCCIEYKLPSGVWESVGIGYGKGDRDWLSCWADTSGKWDEWKKFEPRLYEGRNYKLFALLAGVRNRDGITPISPPKGLAQDHSSLYSTWVDAFGCDGHSHSWLTLEELKKANNTEGLKHQGSGYIHENFYQQFLDSGRKEPNAYCQGAYGSNIEMVSERDYILGKSAGLRKEGRQYQIHVTWEKTQDEILDSLSSTIELMEDLAWKNMLMDSEVRFSFFFDN